MTSGYGPVARGGDGPERGGPSEGTDGVGGPQRGRKREDLSVKTPTDGILFLAKHWWRMEGRESVREWFIRRHLRRRYYYGSKVY